MSPRLLTFMVAFAAFLGPFTQTVYAPILPELGGALRTTPFLINLSISVFTLVLAFMQIIYGPLVDRSGRKRTLLAGLAIYIVASLGCFLADRIETLLAFRALQAGSWAAKRAAKRAHVRGSPPREKQNDPAGAWAPAGGPPAMGHTNSGRKPKPIERVRGRYRGEEPRLGEGFLMGPRRKGRR